MRCKGPEADQDDESELSVAELNMQRERQKKEVELLRQLKAKEMEEIVERKMKAAQDVGCTWGFGIDSFYCFVLILLWGKISFEVPVIEVCSFNNLA